MFMDEGNQKMGLGKVLELLDGILPKILLGPAGPALNRLIAGGLGIPAAWLDQQAQGIQDATVARSHLT
jgi:hypothetical protein